MSSYRNLKDKIKELTEEIDFLKDQLEYRVECCEDLEEKLNNFKNKSWWERLWNL